MMILESVDTSSLSFGVVPESWDCKDTPGQKGTVGFHTDLKIFDFDHEPIRKRNEVERELFRWEKKEVAGALRVASSFTKQPNSSFTLHEASKQYLLSSVRAFLLLFRRCSSAFSCT